MTDLLYNTTSEVAVYLEYEGAPAVGRTVSVSLFSPRNAEVLTNAAATDSGDGWYSTVVPGALLNRRGTWRAEWTSPGSPSIAVTSYYSCGSVKAGALTLAELRRRIAREAGMVIHEGLVSAGSSETIVRDESLVFGADGEFAGAWLLLTSGSAIATERRVTGFDAANTSLYVAPPLASAPSVGTRFLLLAMDTLRPSVITDAINAAIAAIADRVHLERQDESLTTVAGVSEYPLPGGFEMLARVEVADAGGVYLGLLPADWSVAGGLLRLASVPDSSDRGIRLIGTSGADSLAWDAQYCEVLPEYVVAHAVESLHASLGGGQSTDPDDHRRAEAFYASKAEAYRRRAFGRVPANARAVS